MTYAITTPAGPVRSYARLADATVRADKVVAEVNVEVKIVHEETGAVVYLASPRKVLKETEGIAYTPWTRLEQPKFVARDVQGYTIAYTRSRVQAVVLRKNDWTKGDLDNWLVVDERTGGRKFAKDTKGARAITNAMAQGLQL